MKVYRDINSVITEKQSVITIGTFDGLHKGHHKILETLKEKTDNNCTNIVITFDPHPRTVVSKDGYVVKLLTTTEEKIELFEKLGIENLLIIKFDENFAKQTYDEFISEILVKKLHLKELIIGHDHKIGKNREGNELNLSVLAEKYGFNITTVDAEIYCKELISSTKIRHAIENANFDLVKCSLGRNYSFKGPIVLGSQRGRTIGFPTANVNPPSDKIVPPNGVYSVKLNLEGQILYGMMNIGSRPTFDNLPKAVIEVNIFDFNDDIYGKGLEVEIIQFIRKEVKFSSKEELIAQILIDKGKCFQIISKL